MRILVVDDERDIRDILKSTLEAEFFVVDTAADGQEGSYAARTNQYDLIILDNVLPKRMGIDVCRDIRSNGNHTPVLMLSVRSDTNDKTLFLNSGADDYLTKPYSHSELLARIRALLRRSARIEPTVFVAGNIALDVGSHEVTKNGKPVYFTRKEFSLLQLLITHRGKLVSRGMIMEHVWHTSSNPFSKTIEMHIANIRRKLEETDRRLILNVPGRGYKMSVE